MKQRKAKRARLLSESIPGFSALCWLLCQDYVIQSPGIISYPLTFSEKRVCIEQWQKIM